MNDGSEYLSIFSAKVFYNILDLLLSDKICKFCNFENQYCSWTSRFWLLFLFVHCAVEHRSENSKRESPYKGYFDLLFLNPSGYFSKHIPKHYHLKLLLDTKNVIDQCKQKAKKAEKSALPNFGRQKGRLGSAWR